jgi:hypothetical protein
MCTAMKTRGASHIHALSNDTSNTL